MMMKSIRYFVLCIVLLAGACAADNSASPWNGEYLYEAYGGQTFGGSPITIKMVLTIKKNGSKESCLLHADGFQRLDRIICTTDEKGNKLEVKFKSYSDGRTVNAIDLEIYKVGSTLLTLEKLEGKNKEIRYVPRWGSYTVFDDMSKVKEDFKKTK